MDDESLKRLRCKGCLMGSICYDQYHLEKPPCARVGCGSRVDGEHCKIMGACSVICHNAQPQCSKSQPANESVPRDVQPAAETKQPILTQVFSSDTVWISVLQITNLEEFLNGSGVKSRRIDVNTAHIRWIQREECKAGRLSRLMMSPTGEIIVQGRLIVSTVPTVEPPAPAAPLLRWTFKDTPTGVVAFFPGLESSRKVHLKELAEWGFINWYRSYYMTPGAVFLDKGDRVFFYTRPEEAASPSCYVSAYHLDRWQKSAFA
jgi:hypothetical protein